MSLHCDTAYDEDGTYFSRSCYLGPVTQGHGHYLTHESSTHSVSWSSGLPRQSESVQSFSSFQTPDLSSSHLSFANSWADMSGCSYGFQQTGRNAQNGESFPDSRQICEHSSFVRDTSPQSDGPVLSERVPPSPHPSSVCSSPLTELSPSPMLPDFTTTVKEEPDSPSTSPAKFIIEPLSPFVYKRSPSHSSSSTRSSPTALEIDPARRLLESQSLAPPTEVPLRTQANSEMRELMRTIRLNPFSIHTGDSKGRRNGDQENKVEEAKPHEQEPLIFEWQLEGYQNMDMENVELIVLDKVQQRTSSAEDHVKLEETNEFSKSSSSSLYTLSVLKDSTTPGTPVSNDTHSFNSMLEAETRPDYGRRGANVDGGYVGDSSNQADQLDVRHTGSHAPDFVSPHSQNLKSISSYGDSEQYYGKPLTGHVSSDRSHTDHWHSESTSNTGNMKRSFPRLYKGIGHPYNTFPNSTDRAFPTYYDDQSDSIMVRSRKTLRSPEEFGEAVEYPTASVNHDPSRYPPSSYQHTNVTDNRPAYGSTSNESVSHPHLISTSSRNQWSLNSENPAQYRPHRSVNKTYNCPVPTHPFHSGVSNTDSRASPSLRSRSRITSPMTSESLSSNTSNLCSESPPLISPVPRSLYSQASYSQLENTSSQVIRGTGTRDFLAPAASDVESAAYNGVRPPVIGSPYSSRVRNSGRIGLGDARYDCGLDATTRQKNIASGGRRTQVVNPSWYSPHSRLRPRDADGNALGLYHSNSNYAQGLGG